MKDDKVVYWKDIKGKIEKEQFKEKAKQKIKDGLNWASEHKTELIFGGGLLMEGSRLTRKLIDKATDRKKDQYIYDPSLHQKFKLKKKLTGKQQHEINRRYRNGERLTDIYNDMNILK